MHIYNKNGVNFMENVFNSKYDYKIDKLKLAKKRKRKEIHNFIKNNKIFSIIFISFFALSVINFYLIYSFIKILENI